MADHISDPDVEAADEPRRSASDEAELCRVVEDLGVGRAHVLDPDRDVVEPTVCRHMTFSRTSW